MNRKYRKTYMIANWKMNKTATETREFAVEFKKLMSRAKWCDVVICPPSVNIPMAVKSFKDSHVAVGAQNLYFGEGGAFTGEVTARMLKDVGASYVIIGHSERRSTFHEGNLDINKKVHAALKNGLHPIICLGESQAQREMNAAEEHLSYELKMALAGVPENMVRKCIIAYEPLWAIGTGVTATPEQAEEICAMLREIIRHTYGAKVARAISILYGGSMNPTNVVEMLQQPDIDGGLIGGAGLKAESFVSMINKANIEN